MLHLCRLLLEEVIQPFPLPQPQIPVHHFLPQISPLLQPQANWHSLLTWCQEVSEACVERAVCWEMNLGRLEMEQHWLQDHKIQNKAVGTPCCWQTGLERNLRLILLAVAYSDARWGETANASLSSAPYPLVSGSSKDGAWSMYLQAQADHSHVVPDPQKCKLSHVWWKVPSINLAGSEVFSRSSPDILEGFCCILSAWFQWTGCWWVYFMYV